MAQGRRPFSRCIAVGVGLKPGIAAHGERDGDDNEAMLRASYGDANFERLVGVKTTYDPENFFRLNQNIQPMPRTG